MALERVSFSWDMKGERNFDALISSRKPLRCLRLELLYGFKPTLMKHIIQSSPLKTGHKEKTECLLEILKGLFLGFTL